MTTIIEPDVLFDGTGAPGRRDVAVRIEEGASPRSAVRLRSAGGSTRRRSPSGAAAAP